MGIDDLLEAGAGILRDVTSAVESKNYKNLKNSISHRVLTAGDQIRREAVLSAKKNEEERAAKGQYYDDPGPSMATQRQQAAREYAEGKVSSQPYQWQNGAAWRKAQNGAVPPSAQKQNDPYAHSKKAEQAFNVPRTPDVPKTNFLAKPVSKSTGILLTVLGAIGLVVNGLLAVNFLTKFALLEVPGVRVIMMILTVLFSLLAAGSGVMLYMGVKNRSLMNLYYQYGDVVGDAEYVELKNLAGRIGVSTRKVLSDLKKMIRQGFLPKARLDKNETTLMLTDKVYDQYLDAEKSREEQEEKKRREEEAQREAYKDYPPEVVTILTEGQAYVKHVREVNDLIPDTEEMSTRLYKLEEIMNRIFDQVKKKPEQAGNLRRFMDYYLPTIEKLLNGYLELQEAETSENAAQARQEIEGAIDMVNDAFEKLFESFFEDQVWDLSSDISVMKTMLTQDGLVEQKVKV